MSVAKTLEDGIAVITFNRPPVNGFGFGVRSGLVETIHAAINGRAVGAFSAQDGDRQHRRTRS